MKVVANLHKVLYMASDASFCVASFDAVRGSVGPDNTPLGRFTATGAGLNPDAVSLQYELVGEWKTHKRYGMQFVFTSFTESVEQNERGICTYLSKCIRGVGDQTAKEIYKRFGNETLEVLDQTPERLREVPRIGKKSLEKIMDSYAATRGARELVTLLTPYGVSFALCTEIYNQYGAEAMARIKRSPYSLCELARVGFRTADKIAEAFKVAKDDPQRIRTALTAVLQECENGGPLFRRIGSGHLCLEYQEWLTKAEELLATPGISAQTIRDAALVLLSDGTCELFGSVTSAPEAGDMVFRKRTATAEANVARSVARLVGSTQPPSKAMEKALMAAINTAEAQAGVTLAPEQREAVEKCLWNNFTVITGGPGTGKTTIIRIAALAWQCAHPQDTVLLCAPTGKAARRMTEATGYPASTIHKLLGLGIGSDASQRTSVVCDMLIVDEASMLDIYLADHLLSAIEGKTKVLLLGDTNQLPSVGPGAVLSELIACERIPVVRLERIYRQAKGSLIPINAKRISKAESGLEYGAEFQIIECEEFEQASDIISKLYRREAAKVGLDELVILTPRREETATSSMILSARIRNELNPATLNPGTEIKRGARTFRVGDKVMQTKNAEVCNGEVGYVQRIYSDAGEMRMTVNFDGEKVTYAEEDLDNLVLAYALTIHKSQGSEYKTVILNLMEAHGGMLERNLIYTAITRARQKVIIVGQERAVELAIRRESARKRKTLLGARIQERLPKVEIYSPPTSEQITFCV